MSLNKKLYNLYIQTYDWNKRKKLYIQSRSNHKCELCRINDGEEVHHQNYDSLDYDNPGNELDEHLIYVCKECHNYIHTLSTGIHSTRQEDMDDGLRLLEKINIDRRVIFREKEIEDEIKYRIKQEEEKKKKEEEKIINEEYKRKREIEKNIEKTKQEEDRKRQEKKDSIEIFFFNLILYRLYNIF